MSHLKRQEFPKKWPIGRKGSVYIVKPKFSVNEGVPILIILRDMINLAQNRREVKRIVHLRQVLVNNKAVKDEKSNLLLFDVLNITPLKKCYRLELSDKGKFYLKEIGEKEKDKKIAKVIDKRILKGKKRQVNLSDGRNFLSDIECNLNDSVVINLKEGRIEKRLPLEEKSKVMFFAGKHAGECGEVIGLNIKEKTAKIKVDEQEINILINQLMVVE